MKKLTIFALALLTFSACKEKKRPETAMPVPEISVAQPEVRDITLTKDYPGYLVTDMSVNLVGRVNGTLQSIDFAPGSRVKKGQLLFVIEPTVYQDQVAQAESALKTARAQLEYNRNSYERMKEAIKSDAVSKIQVLQAESAVAQAQAGVSNAEAELNTARTNLSYCYVRSPFDGTIDKPQYDPGNYISGAVQPVTLATVYKDDRMYAYFNVSDNQWLSMLFKESEQNNSKLPKEITVRLGKEGSQTYQATLDYLSPSVDLSTGTLNVRANMDNPKGVLKNGLYVTVTLPYGEQKNAVLVPDASIGTDQLGKFVYLVNDSNKVVYRHIVPGQLIDGTLRQVISGVKPEDRYVTQALIKVRDGMEIKPVTAGREPAKP